MVQYTSPLWSAGGGGAGPSSAPASAPEITADASPHAGAPATQTMYPQPQLHVLAAPQFEPQPTTRTQPLNSQQYLPPQQQLLQSQPSQQQQLSPRLQAPADQDAMQRLASGKASPLAPRDGYPVVVHCEAQSRTVSSDPAAAYVSLASRGQTGSSGSGGRGGVSTTGVQPLLSGSGGGADQQQQHRHMLQMASWLVPDARRSYWALFTSVVVLGMAFVFAFMAGDYATWLRTPGAAAAMGGVAPPEADQTQWGPSSLARWLKFWSIQGTTTFNPAYLYAWGARYMPAVRGGQWWRLFSSFCLHSSFTHLLSNMALFVLLTVPLEHTYGPVRIAIIFIASAFGANFLSITFEDPCVLYVGASGAVFGFVGLAISDLLLNWDTVGAPVVRLLVMLAMVGISIAVEYMELPYMSIGKVSHLSHIGGLLGGLFVSFAFLPNLKDRRFKAMRRIVKRNWGHRLPRAAPREHKSCWRSNWWLYWLCMAVCAAAVLFLYVALPLWIWLWKLPRLTCPAVEGLA